jgi:hypothetical protein
MATSREKSSCRFAAGWQSRRDSAWPSSDRRYRLSAAARRGGYFGDGDRMAGDLGLGA